MSHITGFRIQIQVLSELQRLGVIDPILDGAAFTVGCFRYGHMREAERILKKMV